MLFFIMLFIEAFHIYLSTFSGLEVLFGITDKNIIKDYNAFATTPFLILVLITSTVFIAYFFKVFIKVIRMLENRKP